MNGSMMSVTHRDASCGASVCYALPPALVQELTRLWEHPWVEELRLRRGAHSCLYGGGNMIFLKSVLRAEDLSNILNCLCGGSMYAHQDTLRQGYVTLHGGIRVGVCGRMRMDGGRLLGVSDISSLIFRFPKAIPVMTDPICKLLRQAHPGRGVLIYSPPGVGKTTLLRGLIRAMTLPPNAWRVSVIDTREELAACGVEAQCAADWLSGYPRAEGIEIATRTLNPQLIVCDEIGGTGEAEAICAACNGGVPLLATAHGSDVAGLLRRRGLRILHESGVFGSYVGLTRSPSGALQQKVTLARDICC